MAKVKYSKEDLTRANGEQVFKKKVRISEMDRIRNAIDQDYVEGGTSNVDQYQPDQEMVDTANDALRAGKKVVASDLMTQFMSMDDAEKEVFVKQWEAERAKKKASKE